MKNLLRKGLNRVGYDILKLKNSNNTLATNLANVLAARKVGCVIDVGANAGQYGRFLRSIGYSGHILSFEPVGHVFEKLQAAAQGDPRWWCYRSALGDRDEVKEIHVYESTVFSSFLDANAYSRKIWDSLNRSQVEEVQVKRLDGIFPELVRDIGPVGCMLKMDTQGYDANVFEGARGILKDIDVLQSEIATIGIYEHMPDGLDMLKLFRGHGYYISGMFPINREESLAAIEFDCLLVKRGKEAAG